MIGRYLRAALGRYTLPAVEFYRSMFMDVDAVVDVLARVENVKAYLEIGCGDGAISARYARRNPTTRVTGIDVAPNPGELYAHFADVEYVQTSAESLISSDGEGFDLIYVGDVLHHIEADEDRASLLRSASALLKSGGTLVVKEWERRASVQYYAGWFADRFITGDRIRYMNSDRALALILESARDLRVVATGRVPPGKCNIFFALQKST